MLRKEREHVIEERNASGDRGFSCSIDIQLQIDLRFPGGAFNPRLAHWHAGELKRWGWEDKRKTRKEETTNAQEWTRRGEGKFRNWKLETGKKNEEIRYLRGKC